jgi:hypothetical protein
MYDVQRVDHRGTTEMSFLHYEIMWQWVQQIHFSPGLRQSGVISTNSENIYHPIT